MLRFGDYSRDLRHAKWGSGVSLHGSNPKPLMSALGQKQTWRSQIVMSALPPIADIDPGAKYPIYLSGFFSPFQNLNSLNDTNS
jgi:hypothetical protein